MSEEGCTTSEGLRVVTFNTYAPAYRLVAEWADRHGHEIVLVVTAPRSHAARYGEDRGDLLTVVPEEQAVLVTKRLRTIGARVLAALRPDLLISATFPLRIPPEVTELPGYGALNLHPTPLPRGRGPNPQRLIYEGYETLGATLHRLEPEFDAGPILSRKERPLPSDVTVDGVLSAWMQLVGEALEEGTARAIAGEWGEHQDESLATYAAPFTEEERWLSWEEPAATIQRRAAALNLVGATARARIDGTAYLAVDVRGQPGDGKAAPGTVLDHIADVWTVAVANGAVELTARPLDAPAEDQAKPSHRPVAQFQERAGGP